MININDVGIKFKIEKRRRSKTLDFFTKRSHNLLRPSGEFWALRHINFTVEHGNTVGIIGRNGSGKSTLLRVIAGVYPPDEGEVSVEGEVSTLFSLGAGFQPELSGRDNIYLNGVMMGLSKKRIDSTIDSIIEFAELGDFIDMPVRTYSSGMHSRLGFAIAINADKDIVLIDEIMGAGDAAFREKANAAMSRIIGEKTIVLASHGMNTVRKFADKVIWLDKGHISAQGKPEEVIRQYLKAFKVTSPKSDEV